MLFYLVQIKSDTYLHQLNANKAVPIEIELCANIIYIPVVYYPPAPHLEPLVEARSFNDSEIKTPYL